MSFLLRVILPDKPGSLGAVATALGNAGADILGVDVVERADGHAIDDLAVELPPGRPPDVLITAAESVPGVEVESVRPDTGRLETHRELALIETITNDPKEGLTLLAEGVARIFRAGWAIVVVREGTRAYRLAQSGAAPETVAVDLPWLPLERTVVIDPQVQGVPGPWTALDTELAAAPLGLAPRALVVGRPGGPAFRPSELARLAHLTGIIATVLAGGEVCHGPALGEVPDWVGPALRPELAGATGEIIAAVRAGVPEYARPLEGRFGRRITEGVSVALNQFIDLLGVDASPGDLRVYRGLGQLEHREGRTLAALQSAYQVGTRTAWRRIGSGSAAGRLPPEVIFALAEALFTYVEQLGAASVAGWAYEDARNAGSVQTRRHALVELLAQHPPAAPAEVERQAAAAAWRLPERLAALVVEDAVAVAARLPGAVGADLDPVGVALVPIPERPVPGRTGWLDRVRIAVRGRPAVLGPVVAPGRTDRSVARAQAAWPLHVAGLLGVDPDGLVRADEHLLALLLAAEPELAADLCQRAVAPLQDLPDGAATRGEQTLRAWLDAHGDVSVAAAALHVHPQTVRYRLAGLREVFGDALDDPAARLELTIALRMTHSGPSTPPTPPP